MDSFAAVKSAVEALEALQIDYMIVGALSANAYSISRSTNDADFVINPQPGQISAIMKQLGVDFELDPQPQFETLTNSVRNIVTHLPSDFQIELFRLNVKDEHHMERFRRRRQRFVGEINREAWIPTAEDVVIQKLRWQRRKDLDDAKNVLAVSGAGLDWDYLHSWTQKHGTYQLLQDLLQEIPKTPQMPDLPS